MITNEQIVERVMRMGIEYRSGITDVDKLFDLAKSQLKRSCSRHGVIDMKCVNDWRNTNETQIVFGLLLTADKRVEVVRIPPQHAKNYKVVKATTAFLPTITLV